MKRTLALPLCVLAALLAFSLWNIRHMDGETDRWRAQLQQADRLGGVVLRCVGVAAVHGAQGVVA